MPPARLWRLLLAILLAAPALRPAMGWSRPATGCPGLFAGGQPPALLNPRLGQRTRLLCFGAFAALASGATRGPLWSAERLTAGAVGRARETPRRNAFHPEAALPPEDRAELADYARSGYDRGHMAPSGDMPDPAAQQQSFSLANVVPQTPQLNRRAWERIESAVRERAAGDGPLYVVTGPVFQGGDLQALNGRVLVPTSTFKAVYDPARGAAGAYVCTNTARPECRTVSIAELEGLTGVDPFPAAPAGVKATLARLPQPRPYWPRH
jgi:endonuclease G, mitochondrial